MTDRVLVIVWIVHDAPCTVRGFWKELFELLLAFARLINVVPGLFCDIRQLVRAYPDNLEQHFSRRRPWFRELPQQREDAFET